MLDRKYFKVGEHVDRQLAAGVTQIEEGAVMCEVIENGAAAVTVVASPTGSEKIAGIAILPFYLPTQIVQLQQFTVPASGNLVFSLRYNNLVAGSIRASVAGQSDLTVDETNFSATAPTGTVKVDDQGGRVQFAAGNAGLVVTITYRANMTLQQARMRFQERALNNRGIVQELQMVSVAKGYIEMATDQFDTTADFSSGNALKLGANGLITNSGNGPAIPGGKVLALPDQSGTAQGPFLRFSALIA